MKREEYIKELKVLYNQAKTNEQTMEALELLERLRKLGSNAKKKARR